ncbi:unnamed protein product [Nippostrongylus brasiliensis]|uniref:Protein SERAC1 (inferred by orthology to a human protein) n=1 Tax=Nippostrongylus brasiliensis TaxID=27835 RepID=A0A0N4YNW8_NIPBR|nr:unnamed protein product [Nippostrongylus brasiliensis]
MLTKVLLLRYGSSSNCLFNIGDEWNAGIAWLNRVACPEEDLACTDEWLARRPSQILRLFQLLRLMFVKTELSFDASVIGVDVVPALHVIFTQFRDTHKDISLLVLKILSNIALNSTPYAVKIFTSEWLPLLASMVTRGKSLEERLLSHKICQNALSTLGVVDYQLCSDVYEVFLPEQQPEDWLHLDIPQPMRILGLDYPSSLMQFRRITESLQVRADRFKHQLAAAGIGRRPVIFICHSMGGLLAKRLLLDLPELAEKTVGILFICTPHRGSPIAAWGYSILQPTADVLFLLEENPLNKKVGCEIYRHSSEGHYSTHCTPVFEERFSSRFGSNFAHWGFLGC